MNNFTETCTQKKLKADDLIVCAQNNDLNTIKNNFNLIKNSSLHLGWMLHTACEKGFLELAQFLEEKGADIRYRDDSCLADAAINNHIEVVEFCLDKGCDPTSNNSYALRYAAVEQNLEVCQLLVEAGAQLKDLDWVDELPENVKHWIEMYYLNQDLNDNLIETQCKKNKRLKV